MSRITTALLRAAALCAVVSVAACSATTGSSGERRTGAAPSPSDGSAATTPTVTPTAPAEPAAVGTRVRITFAGERVDGTVRDTAAGRDLVAQLPLEIDMTDHGGVEKTGRLPRAISTSEEPPGADPEVGAIGYYAPGTDFVLYYGDQSYFDGIVVIGDMDDGFERLGQVDGDVTVTVEQIDPS